MTDQHWRIAELIKKHLQETITADERIELDQWIAESDANRQFFNRFEDKDYVANELELISRADTDAALDKTLNQLGMEPAVITPAVDPFAEQQPVARLGWLRYAAAATILVAVAAGGYFWMHRQPVNNNPVASTAPTPDVAPGSDKAILTLSDGSTIVLDSAANGKLAQQGATNVVKQDGQLKYSGQGGNYTGAVVYNTVRTPRGGQYELVLQDGTKVWLNSASTLKYPIAFDGKDRMVELTGEGYFEVKSLASNTGGKIPFKVVVPGGQEVDVLGTHFNIMAYKDEPLMRTTLLEGSVRVKPVTLSSSKGESTILAPGQQAQLTPASGAISVDEHADVDQAVAWKNGLQDFNNADLPTIMRQVSRWYDVDVVYAGNVPPMMGLNGKIPRSMTLKSLLKALEVYDSQLHFKFENGVVTVLP